MLFNSMQKGRSGKLIKPDGTIIDWALSKDILFEREDLVVDSVSLYNRRFAGVVPVPNTTQYAEAERLAKLGFTVFCMSGNNTDQLYMFAVSLTEDDSEMD